MGDLGALLRLDEEGRLRASPNSWAYRIFYFNPRTGLYQSPYVGGKKARGSRRGEKVIETRERGSGQGRTAEETIRKNLEKMSDEDVSYINDNYEDDGLSERLYEGDLVRHIGGDPTELGEGYIINAGSADYDLYNNFAPHYGFSVIGAPHSLYSIVRDADISKGGPRWGFSKKEVMDALGRAKSLRDLQALNWAANGNILKSDIENNFFDSPLWKERLEADMIKRGFDPSDMLFSDIKDMLGVREANKVKDRIPNVNAREALAEFLASEMGNYIPYNANGKEFFDNPSRAFQNSMHDTLVENIVDTFMDSYSIGAKSPSKHRKNPKNYRLVQVAAPIEALVSNDDVLRGDVSGQRDFMNELLVNSYSIPTDGNGRPLEIGNINSLLAPNGPVWNYYVNRIRGMSGEEAWNAAMGKRWGDLKYLLSDDDMKDVCKGLKDGLDDYVSRSAILSGLKRGPGNG